MEEENNRIKTLLIATVSAYLIALGVGVVLNRLINSEEFLVWTVEHSWGIYLTYFMLFISYCWIPLILFLFVQGIRLRQNYQSINYRGDRTVGNLAVLIPIIIGIVYFGTRLLS